MDYMAILIILCVTLTMITYKYVHYALLKWAIHKKRYEIAVSMRFFSRFVDLLNIWGIIILCVILLALFIEMVFEWDSVSLLAIPLMSLIIGMVYLLSHLSTAIISITNYHYHFSRYILYLRAFKDDISRFDRRYVTSIQEYTNLKMLGIGDPSMLYHDTSFIDILNDKMNLSMVFRTERIWKNTIAKLMKKSQFILVKVDSTDGVMYEINYALTHHAKKVIFLIEEKEDFAFFNNQLNDMFDMSLNCSLPALAFVVDGVIETSPITNIGMSLQYCFNHMSKSIPNRFYDVDAEKLYWKAWDIYHSSGFRHWFFGYAYRKKFGSRLLWKSYCNGCEKAAELLKIILTEYPDLKNTWSENLFQ